MDLLDRLHQRLLSSLAQNSDPAGKVTIGDLYQRLIPYRVIRGELGVMELPVYEHALLRLLAGERGLAEVQDPAARLEFQRELGDLNPILGIYRDYSSVAVRIRHRAEPRDATLTEAAAVPAMATGQASAEPAPVASQSTVADGPSRVPESDSPEHLVCPACDRQLPTLPDLRYCPFCGMHQDLTPCERCGARLESGWSFCVRCGAAAGPL